MFTKPLRVAVVGPCASGKTTLARALEEAGFDVRQPAQEHSYVPSMWRKMTRPDILIYLDVDYAHTRERAPDIKASSQRLAEQHEKLAHARRHCHFYLDTSRLTPAEVQAQVFDFLQQRLGG